MPNSGCFIEFCGRLLLLFKLFLFWVLLSSTETKSSSSFSSFLLLLKLKLFEELKVLGFVFELTFVLLSFKLFLLLLSFGGFIVNELLSFKSPNKSSNFFVGLISFFCSNCC